MVGLEMDQKVSFSSITILHPLQSNTRNLCTPDLRKMKTPKDVKNIAIELVDLLKISFITLMKKVWRNSMIATYSITNSSGTQDVRFPLGAA